jgi:hypothetical protein
MKSKSLILLVLVLIILLFVDVYPAKGNNTFGHNKDKFLAAKRPFIVTQGYITYDSGFQTL